MTPTYVRTCMHTRRGQAWHPETMCPGHNVKLEEEKKLVHDAIYKDPHTQTALSIIAREMLGIQNPQCLHLTFINDGNLEIDAPQVKAHLTLLNGQIIVTRTDQQGQTQWAYNFDGSLLREASLRINNVATQIFLDCQHRCHAHHHPMQPMTMQPMPRRAPQPQAPTATQPRRTSSAYGSSRPRATAEYAALVPATLPGYNSQVRHSEYVPRQYTNLTADVDALLKEKDAHISTLRQRAENAEAHRDDLREFFLRNPHAPVATLTALQARLEEQERELVRAQEELHDARRGMATLEEQTGHQVESLRRQLAKATALLEHTTDERERLLQLAERNQAKTEEVQAQLRVSDDQKEKLMQRLREIEYSLDGTERRSAEAIQKLQAEFTLAIEQADRLASSHKQLEQRHVELQHEHTATRKHLRLADQKTQEAERIAENLREQLHHRETELLTRATHAEAQNRLLQEQCHSLEEKMSSLEASAQLQLIRYRSLESDLNTARSTIAQKQQAVETLDAQLHIEREKTFSLIITQEELKKTICTLTKQTSYLENEQKRLNLLLEQTTENQRQTELQLTQVMGWYQQAEEQRDLTQRERAELRDRLWEKTNNLDTITQQFHSLRLKQADLEHQHDLLHAQVADISDQLRSAQQKLSKARETARINQEELDQKQETIKTLQQQNQSLNEELQKAIETRDTKIAECGHARLTIIRQTSEIAELKQQIKSKETALHIARDELTALQTQLTTAKDRELNAEALLKDQAARIAELELALREKDAAAERSATATAALRQRVGVAEGQAREFEDIFHRLHQIINPNLSPSTNTLDMAGSLVQSLNKILRTNHEYQQRLIELEQKLQELSALIEQKDAASDNDRRHLEQQVADLTQKYDELLTNHTASLKLAEQKEIDLKVCILNLQDEKSAAEHCCQVLESRIAELEQSSASNASEVQELRQRLSEQEARANVLAVANAELNQELERLRAQPPVVCTVPTIIMTKDGESQTSPQAPLQDAAVGNDPEEAVMLDDIDEVVSPRGPSVALPPSSCSEAEAEQPAPAPVVAPPAVPPQRRRRTRIVEDVSQITTADPGVRLTEGQIAKLRHNHEVLQDMQAQINDLYGADGNIILRNIKTFLTSAEQTKQKYKAIRGQCNRWQNKAIGLLSQETTDLITGINDYHPVLPVDSIRASCAFDNIDQFIQQLTEVHPTICYTAIYHPEFTTSLAAYNIMLIQAISDISAAINTLQGIQQRSRQQNTELEQKRRQRANAVIAHNALRIFVTELNAKFDLVSAHLVNIEQRGLVLPKADKKQVDRRNPVPRPRPTAHKTQQHIRSARKVENSESEDDAGSGTAAIPGERDDLD